LRYHLHFWHVRDSLTWCLELVVDLRHGNHEAVARQQLRGATDGTRHLRGDACEKRIDDHDVG